MLNEGWDVIIARGRVGRKAREAPFKSDGSVPKTVFVRSGTAPFKEYLLCLLACAPESQLEKALVPHLSPKGYYIALLRGEDPEAYLAQRRSKRAAAAARQWSGLDLLQNLSRSTGSQHVQGAAVGELEDVAGAPATIDENAAEESLANDSDSDASVPESSSSSSSTSTSTSSTSSSAGSTSSTSSSTAPDNGEPSEAVAGIGDAEVCQFWNSQVPDPPLSRPKPHGLMS